MVITTKFGDKYECDSIEPDFSEDGQLIGFSLYTDEYGFIYFLHADMLTLIEHKETGVGYKDIK